MAKPSPFAIFRATLTHFALQLPGAPRLSNFEMIEAPASAREMHEAILEALRDALQSAAKAPSASAITSAAESINNLTGRIAVAEVDLSTGVWPFRKTRRVRIMRPSHVQYWTYEDGSWTPGSQAEELERRWAITQDYRRQALGRSLQKQLESARPEGA